LPEVIDADLTINGARYRVDLRHIGLDFHGECYRPAIVEVG
jgi:hypothetical protein